MKFPCTICERSFMDRDGLILHYIENHMELRMNPRLVK